MRKTTPVMAISGGSADPSSAGPNAAGPNAAGPSFACPRSIARTIGALLTAFGLLASLSACVSSSAAAGCEPTVLAGPASKLISVSGAFGEAPKVKFPTPLYSVGTQVSLISAGTGPVITTGQPLAIFATVYNARSGKVLQQMQYGDSVGSIMTVQKKSVWAVSAALECLRVGSRVAVISSANQSHAGETSDENGLEANDSLIYVFDLKQAYLTRANGVPQVPRNGSPTVVTTDAGRPGITMPTLPSPKKLGIEVLKRGSGNRVKAGGFALVKYTALGWEDKTVFDTSWETNEPAILTLDGKGETTGLVQGILGQRVGSQLILSVPADLATGGSPGSGGTPPAGQAVLYVVDILGADG